MLVGRVGFGESFQACPANYSAEDAMARSIVRLERENEELRAEVAMLEEERNILRAKL
jgi:cell division protein FtsB